VKMKSESNWKGKSESPVSSPLKYMLHGDACPYPCTFREEAAAKKAQEETKAAEVVKPSVCLPFYLYPMYFNACFGRQRCTNGRFPRKQKSMFFVFALHCLFCSYQFFILWGFVE
jgi:hypothetical protein